MIKKLILLFVLFGSMYAPTARALNDRYLAQQGYLSSIGYTESLKVQAEGAGTVVAVIDSGVWLAQPELENNIWLNSREIPQNDLDDDNNGFVDDYYGWNFVDGNSDMQAKTAHGTNVAGIIAARHDSIGIAGIAPRAKIMSIIACNTEGACSNEAIQNAIKYAVDNGAQVINLSLGKRGYLGYNSSFNASIKYAYDRNVVIVAAAGNGDVEARGALGQNLSFVKASPVCNESNGSNMILGVGATGASWSNYGACVDILAPGEEIVTTSVPLLNGGYGYESLDGTSFSAPMVSAAAALLKSKYPLLKNWEIIDILLSSASQGRLNIASGLGYSRPHCTINAIQSKQVNSTDSVIISGTNIDSTFRPRLLGDNAGVSFSQSIVQNVVFLDSNRIQINLAGLNLRPGTYRVADSESVCEVANITFQVIGNSNLPVQTSAPTLSVSDVMPSREVVIVPSVSITPRVYDMRLTQRLAGNILLQKESRGEAWYLNPTNSTRYYLRDGLAAYTVMRSAGQGIADADLSKIPASLTTDEIKNATSICSSNALANRMKGKILLQVQQHGEAWYIYPKNCRRIYLKDGEAAYQAMRYLGLGIKNSDLDKIPGGN